MKISCNDQGLAPTCVDGWDTVKHDDARMIEIDDEVEHLRCRLSLLTKLVRDSRGKVKRCKVWCKVYAKMSDTYESEAWRAEAVAWAQLALRARTKRRLLIIEINDRLGTGEGVENG